MTAREDDFTSTVDAAAAFEAERAQNSPTVERHECSYALNGGVLACFCGSTVDWSDAEP